MQKPDPLHTTKYERKDTSCYPVLCSNNRNKQDYKAGGAQAIAALAYGTESVPKVHKIFGPGNQYVTAAKQIVAERGIAIDLPAGPSEVAVYADSSANPDFIATDLLSQAEHGADSQVILVQHKSQLSQNRWNQFKNFWLIYQGGKLQKRPWKKVLLSWLKMKKSYTHIK